MQTFTLYKCRTCTRYVKLVEGLTHTDELNDLIGHIGECIHKQITPEKVDDYYDVEDFNVCAE